MSCIKITLSGILVKTFFVSLVLSLSFFFCSFLNASPAFASESGANHSQSIKVNGRRRIYTLHIPAGDSNNLPLIVVLHGFLSGRKYVSWDTEMSAAANKRHFFVVYPKGVGASWNAGTCCGKSYTHKVDDVLFIQKLVATLVDQYHLNPQMVYATGFSNGGMMCYRLASELSQTFAAVAPVEGNMSLKLAKPEHPVSIFIVHGAKDTVFPIGGGTGRWLLDTFPVDSIDEISKFWVDVNHCTQTPVVENTDVYTKQTFSNGADGTEVCVLVAKHNGHQWPMGREARLFHHTRPNDFSTTSAICDFFFAHSKSVPR